MKGIKKPCLMSVNCDDSVNCFPGCDGWFCCPDIVAVRNTFYSPSFAVFMELCGLGNVEVLFSGTIADLRRLVDLENRGDPTDYYDPTPW